MPESLTFTYLNHHDIMALQMTAEEILMAVEGGLRAQGNDETVVEPRVHLVPESSAHGRVNVLCGYLRLGHAMLHKADRLGIGQTLKFR